MPTCRPGSVSWMAFSPGDKRNTAKVARTHPHRRWQCRTASRRSTPAIGTGTTTSHPVRAVVPATVPSQTHTDSSVPVPLRPYTAVQLTLGRGTCAV
jgi:hypothetical protein